jgi:hypothetical protein
MKWLAAWVTFSCVVVPVWALLCARLREVKRWTVYTGNRSVETQTRVRLAGRPESLVSN